MCGAVALFGAVHAQSFGVKAGLNVTNIHYFEPDSKMGFHVGVFMNNPIASGFSIQPEVMYSAKGAKNGDVSVNLDYISVPVMFQFNLMPELYLEAGPEFSVLLSAKRKAGNENVLYENSENLSVFELGVAEGYDFSDNFKSFDLGVGIGAGYYFLPNMGVNVRYVVGFTDAWKYNYFVDRYLNRAFQAGLSYKF